MHKNLHHARTRVFRPTSVKSSTQWLESYTAWVTMPLKVATLPLCRPTLLKATTDSHKYERIYVTEACIYVTEACMVVTDRLFAISVRHKLRCHCKQEA